MKKNNNKKNNIITTIGLLANFAVITAVGNEPIKLEDIQLTGLGELTVEQQVEEDLKTLLTIKEIEKNLNEAQEIKQEVEKDLNSLQVEEHQKILKIIELKIIELYIEDLKTLLTERQVQQDLEKEMKAFLIERFEKPEEDLENKADPIATNSFQPTVKALVEKINGEKPNVKKYYIGIV